MTDLNIETARYNMIEQQVRPWDVLDPRVLEVMNSVHREEFVPEQYRSVAFSDVQIPVGHGQHMMEPRVEGRMLQALNIKPTDRVLEIGTGTGFVTACLASLGQNVVTVEIHEELSKQAEQTLNRLGFDNISFRVGNAAINWDQEGPFDVIAVTASMPRPHQNYQPLLRNDGRLFVVTGTMPVMTAHLITCTGDDQYQDEILFETSLDPLESMTAPEKFEF